MRTPAPSLRSDWPIAVGLLLVPLLVVVAAEALLPGFELMVDDGPLDYQPPLVDAVHQVWHGRLPLWSDATWCGYPLLARGQPGSLYPVHHLAAVIARLAGLRGQPLVVSFALHLSMAAAMAFVLLRLTGASRLAGVLAGIGIGLAGPALGICGSWPVLWLFVPWLCLALAAVERISAGAKGPWVAALGLSVGMVALVGYPEGMLAFAIMLGVATLVLVRWRTWGEAVPRILAGGGLGLLIGACQLLSTGQLALLGRRAHGWGLAETTSLALDPVHLLGLLAPWTEEPFHHTHRFYPGGALWAGPWVVLGLLALAAWWRRDRIAGAMTAGLVAATILSLGDTLPGARWLFSVPPLAYFRWPIKHTVELSVMAALAAGYGLTLLLDRLDRRRTEAVLWIHLALQAIALATLPMSTFQPGLALVIAGSIAAFSITLLVLQRVGSRRAFAATLGVAGVVLPILNLPLAADARIDKIERPRAEAALPGMQPSDRILLLFDDVDARIAKRAGLPAYNLAHARPDVARVLGHDALRPAYYTWLDGLDPTITGNVVDPQRVASWLASNRMLPFVRAGLVVVPERQQRLVEAAESNPHLEPAGVIGELLLYTSTSPRPVAFLAEEVRVVASAEEAGRAFAVNDRPLELVHVEGPVPELGPRPAPGGVRVVARDVGRLELEVREPLDSGSFLVVTSSWYPGWRAVVDGGAEPIHRVNGSFLGVVLPPGGRHVVLSYRPGWLVLACVLSGLALLVTTVLVLRGLRRAAGT
jgi:hypothetical protein